MRAIAEACRPYGALLAGMGHAGVAGLQRLLPGGHVGAVPGRRRRLPGAARPARAGRGGAIVAAFAAAARLAAASGLDGVEVDAGAWSLLRQFHSSLTNLRADGYGEDRLRFTGEVLAGVRGASAPMASWPSGSPVTSWPRGRGDPRPPPIRSPPWPHRWTC